ncbi:MAG: hypothetical protein ACP5HK_04905 [Acidilobus sp.]
MSNHISDVGRIIIRCRRCGAILYKYAIGDKADKNKFNGPPVPKKVLGGYDDMTCPMCGAKLSIKPAQLRFLPAMEFSKLYVEDDFRLVLRSERVNVVSLGGLQSITDASSRQVVEENASL